MIRRHTIDGYELLSVDDLFASAAPIVRSHDERVDAHGYPDRLAGEQIPLGARIVAACDAGTRRDGNTRQYHVGMGE